MKKLILFFLLAVVAFRLPAQKSPSSAATPLTQWLDLHCQLVRQAKGIAHVAYSRHFSYTAIAAYEALAGYDPSALRLSGQLTAFPQLPSVPAATDARAVLSAVYADMLRYFYGSFSACTAAIDSLEQLQRSQRQLSSATETASTQYGRAIAQQIQKWAATDGAGSNRSYAPVNGEGLWSPAPPAFTVAEPYWYENRSFTRDLMKLYNLKQPVYTSDHSAPFYTMAREVYEVTNALTPEQKAIALFWDDSPNGKYMTVYGHWTSILSGLIKKQGLSLQRAADGFVSMTLAMHEASLLAWKGKYSCRVLRPISYIRQFIDKDWTPLIGTPPHPEFPAAHATLSQAAATALCSVFGTSCAVTDKSYSDIGMNERSFGTIQDAAREAGISRLYGGIHYRYSIEQGFALGEAAARQVLEQVHLTRDKQKLTAKN